MITGYLEVLEVGMLIVYELYELQVQDSKGKFKCVCNVSVCVLLTPVVDGCEGTEETVVCWVATDDDLCCSSTVLACW